VIRRLGGDCIEVFLYVECFEMQGVCELGDNNVGMLASRLLSVTGRTRGKEVYFRYRCYQYRSCIYNLVQTVTTSIIVTILADCHALALRCRWLSLKSNRPPNTSIVIYAQVHTSYIYHISSKPGSLVAKSHISCSLSVDPPTD
jgi:hypothetical protein